MTKKEAVASSDDDHEDEVDRQDFHRCHGMDMDCMMTMTIDEQARAEWLNDGVCEKRKKRKPGEAALTVS